MDSQKWERRTENVIYAHTNISWTENITYTQAITKQTHRHRFQFHVAVLGNNVIKRNIFVKYYIY